MTAPDGPEPWTPGHGQADPKRHAPATERNRGPIVEVLRDVLPEEGVVLEIASGSGEHVVHFARELPGLRWQPSDPDPASQASIAAWTAESGQGTVADPIDLNAASGRWPIDAADAILCINMIHISPWAATEGLMQGAGKLLPEGAPLFLYGPFVRADVETAPSNVAFDRSLRERDADWGLRDLGSVLALGRRNSLVPGRIAEMPANNLAIVLRKDSAKTA